MHVSDFQSSKNQLINIKKLIINLHLHTAPHQDILTGSKPTTLNQHIRRNYVKDKYRLKISFHYFYIFASIWDESIHQFYHRSNDASWQMALKKAVAIVFGCVAKAYC